MYEVQEIKITKIEFDKDNCPAYLVGVVVSDGKVNASHQKFVKDLNEANAYINKILKSKGIER